MKHLNNTLPSQKKVRVNSQMKASRECKRFALATGLIIIAALNTGNNLIYLILSMMLSILVLSLVILKMNMRGLVLKVLQGGPLFANSPAGIDISISNKKRVLSSYSVKVFMSESIEGEIYFPKISGLSETIKIVPVVCRKRGIYRYGDFYLESSFPFIFFKKKIVCKVDGELFVYPEIKSVDGIIPEMPGTGYELSRERFSRGEEFSMMREFRYGDDWRRIHWKTSAKTANLMVMEYASEEPGKLTIILDNLMAPDADLFEKAVSFAASVTDLFLKQGYFVRLLTCKKVIPFGIGKEHLFKILDILALIEIQNLWECPLSDEPEGMTVLILSSDYSPLRHLISVSDIVIHAANL
jgi:uncharacterized protein (DUF58 family)